MLAAFSVVLGTLVIQGLTLKFLLRALDLHDDDPWAAKWARHARAPSRRHTRVVADDQSPIAMAVRKSSRCS